MSLAARVMGRLFPRRVFGRQRRFGDTAAPWAPTHRHRKGGHYRVLSHGILEKDRSDVVIYDDAKGQVWVRPVAEFYDGRFEALAEGSK